MVSRSDPWAAAAPGNLAATARDNNKRRVVRIVLELGWVTGDLTRFVVHLHPDRGREGPSQTANGTGSQVSPRRSNTPVFCGASTVRQAEVCQHVPCEMQRW